MKTLFSIIIAVTASSGLAAENDRKELDKRTVTFTNKAGKVYADVRLLYVEASGLTFDYGTNFSGGGRVPLATLNSSDIERLGVPIRMFDAAFRIESEKIAKVAERLAPADTRNDQPSQDRRGHLGKGFSFIEGKYGAPIGQTNEHGLDLHLHKFKDYEILVMYSAKTCVAELVQSKHRMDDAECVALAQAIGARGEYVKSTTAALATRWDNSEAKVWAVRQLSFVGNNLLVVDALGSSHLAEWIKAQTAAKVEGF